MRCTKCGSDLSRVVATRTEDDRALIVRRRECFNGHRFNTYEVHESVAGTIRDHVSPKRGAKLEQQAARWARDRAIARAVVRGAMVKDVAQQYGLAANTVSWILRRHAPDFNARARAKGKK